MTLPTGTKRLALLIELPDTYTDDIVEGGALREYLDEFQTESDFILNSIGEPGIVRVRMEISGEKDSTVVEVWGSVREASLVEPSVGYEPGGVLTGDQLQDHGGYKLLREEYSCEWCHLDYPEENE